MPAGRAAALPAAGGLTRHRPCCSPPTCCRSRPAPCRRAAQWTRAASTATCALSKPTTRSSRCAATSTAGRACIGALNRAREVLPSRADAPRRARRPAGWRSARTARRAPSARRAWRRTRRAARAPASAVLVGLRLIAAVLLCARRWCRSTAAAATARTRASAPWTACPSPAGLWRSARRCRCAVQQPPQSSGARGANARALAAAPPHAPAAAAAAAQPLSRCPPTRPPPRRR
jgi:hypothetical protein